MTWDPFGDLAPESAVKTRENAVAMVMNDVEKSITPFKDVFGDPEPGKPPDHPARTVNKVASGIMGMINLPMQLMNTGFAAVTAGIASMFPAFPAATQLKLYLGPPHPHGHPPSLVPPAPPVPLPSFGPAMIGTNAQVIIEGMMAARAGDIGVALTCCGFVPMYEIFTGSSNVFIGGVRATRQTDVCRECQPAAAGWAKKVAAGMAIAGQVVAATAVVADTVDAFSDTGGGSADVSPEAQAAQASAKALAASMGALQAAQDAITLAISMSLGTDPALVPAPGFMVTGASKVQIGGFPMINFPNPALALLNALGKLRRGKKPAGEEADALVGSSACKVPR